MDNAPVRPGDVIAGKFEVERLLGEGGMGVVVAARHLELDERVAVKFLLPEIAKREDAAERFKREARAAVKIKSEHVARVRDVGTTDDGVPYMVMEYLEGHDLGEELRMRGPLPVAEAVRFLLEACEAVAEAHAAGIVHRDLKPANLFLAQRADGTRLVKVLDFGISKSVAGTSSADLSLTATSTLIGSPLYMSPEQMHSAKNVDTRTDIWSLGAILFQLLTNRPPYMAESIPQLCNALLNDLPPPLASFRDDVPEALQAALTRALTKQREQRWQSVGDLCQALVPFAPEAKIHADRAARLLSTQGDKPGAAATTERSVPPPGSSISVAISGESQGIGDQATEVSGAPAGVKTQDSWGKTGGSQSKPPAARSRSFAVIGAGAVVAIAVVAWGISRNTATATPSATPAADPPRAAEPSTPVVTATPTPEPAPTVEPAPAAAAEAADAGTKSQPPSAQKQPTSHANAPKERPSKPQSKPTSPATDFGGRR